MSDANMNVLGVASVKTLAQIAYEAFLSELAKTQDAAEAEHAPAWDAVPEHVKIVIAEAVGAALRSFAPALVCEVDHEEQSFAQVGYQAYVARTGGLNYQGLPCPTFEALTDTIKAAWAAASTAIRSEHEHRFAGEYDLTASEEELAQLIAGLDALQRSDAHHGDVMFPLRSRLRALLAQPQSDAEGELEAPPEAASDAAKQPPTGVEEPATEQPPAEPAADQGIELPSPSKAPAAPGLPGLDSVIPGPSALPTDIDATTPSEAEKPADPAPPSEG